MSGSETGYIESRLIRVSASEAPVGETNTDFSININSLLKAISKISIKTVSFMNNFYNITDTKGAANNDYSYTVGATTYTNTIPPGWYTIETLMTLMSTTMTTESGTDMKFTQDETTVHVTLSTDSVSTVTLHPSGVFKRMGFEVERSGDSTHPLVGENLPELQGLTMVFLRSSIMAPGFSYDENGEIGNIVTPIPITAPFGVLNIMECKVDRLCEITFKNPTDLTSIDFQLTDSAGTVLDLQGGNLRIDLRCYYNYQ
jgi:hypothetical protein